jgi:molybdopterin synthase catalytic subunit
VGNVQNQAGVHEKEEFSLTDLVKSVKKTPNFHKAGAIALFVGVVRGETLKGEKVEKLELQAYEEKANQVLKDICDDLLKKYGVVDVQIHHLLGEFNVGEDLVYVSVAGSHRRGLFRVLEEAVERYKKEVPIFKKEYVTDEKGKKITRWLTEGESASEV